MLSGEACDSVARRIQADDPCVILGECEQLFQCHFAKAREVYDYLPFGQ